MSTIFFLKNQIRNKHSSSMTKKLRLTDRRVENIPLLVSCGIIITDRSNTFQYFVAWGIIITALYNILELRLIKISSKYYWKKMTRIKTSHVVSSEQNNIQRKFIVKHYPPGDGHLKNITSGHWINAYNLVFMERRWNPCEFSLKFSRPYKTFLWDFWDCYISILSYKAYIK